MELTKQFLFRQLAEVMKNESPSSAMIFSVIGQGAGRDDELMKELAASALLKDAAKKLYGDKLERVEVRHIGEEINGSAFVKNAEAEYGVQEIRISWKPESEEIFIQSCW